MYTIEGLLLIRKEKSAKHPRRFGNLSKAQRKLSSKLQENHISFCRGGNDATKLKNMTSFEKSSHNRRGLLLIQCKRIPNELQIVLQMTQLFGSTRQLKYLLVYTFGITCNSDLASTFSRFTLPFTQNPSPPFTQNPSPHKS